MAMSMPKQGAARRFGSPNPFPARPEILGENKNFMDYPGQPVFKYGFTEDHLPAVRPVENREAI